MAMAGIAIWAQDYTVHSVSKGVQVERRGQTEALTQGMGLSANDIVIVPNGGSVSILEKRTNDIYTSVSPGRQSVAGLKIGAKRSASSNVSTLISGASGRFMGGTSSGTVYKEKGMINRSLAVYDPDGDNVEMASGTLANYIASGILNRRSDGVPIPLKFGANEAGGLYFRIENTLDYPVYFNVLNVSRKGVEISPLGQPNGTYVVLPKQSLQREHLASLAEEDTHIIILTPCQFDLDAVVEEANGILRKGVAEPTEDISACIQFLN